MGYPGGLPRRATPATPLSPLTVTFPTNIHFLRGPANEFRRRAREAFPKETVACLLGTATSRYVRITDLWIPEDMQGDRGYVIFDDSDAKNVARDLGLLHLGDIHSHCWPWPKMKNVVDASPSEDDLAQPGVKLQAICAVTQSAKGRLSTRIRVWPPVKHLEVTFV